MRGFSVRRGDAFFNDRPTDRTLLTAGDAAKVLDLTRQWVCGLARDGQLAGERTIGGQWIFRRAEVRRFHAQRADARERSRDARLRVVRVRMLKAGYEPRQLALFGPRLTLVRSRPRGERALSDREVKAAQSLADCGVSEKGDYVDQKVAGSRG